MRSQATRWHRTLPARLFAAIVVVAAFAVAATAYLTEHETRDVIQHEQGRAAANNQDIYSALVHFAATHPSWSGVRPLVRQLADKTGLRIAVVSDGLRVDSETGAAAPTGPSVGVDPLDVDTSLDHDADAQHISYAAVGPFELTAEIRARLLARARTARDCLRLGNTTSTVVVSPSGRPYISGDTTSNDQECLPSAFIVRTKSESVATTNLNRSFHDCLPSARGNEVIYVTSATSAPVIAYFSQRGALTTNDTLPGPVAHCLLSARRHQLAPYVAPMARLYVTDEAGNQVGPRVVPHVSPARVALAAGVVLALAALVAGLAALRFGRSLRSVTKAANRMRHGDSTVRVTFSARRARRRPDDLTQLAVAFNDMAAAVEAGERQQKDMIADVSHELRSPLTNIAGWIEALQDGVVEPEPKTLDTIASQARQLERIVDDLRDLALAEAGQLNLGLIVVPAATILDEVVAAYAVRARDADIELTTRIDTEAFLHVDPARLAQCLGNLVSNAIAYTPSGGHVQIRLRCVRDVVEFDVEDDGIGIAAGDLPHVFDRLWRAEQSRSRRAGGSGLGLAIARRIARAHRGDITLSSTPGRGSTFTLTLPRHRSRTHTSAR